MEVRSARLHFRNGDGFGSETTKTEAMTAMKNTILNHAPVAQSPDHCRRVPGIMQITNVLVIFLVTSVACLSQTPPFLSLTKPSAAQLKLSWTAQTGTNYQPDFAQELDVFSLWSPLGNELLALSNSLQVTFSQPTNAQEFYRVRSLPDDGFPHVRVIAPTNGATVNGTVQVWVSAKDDRRLSAVTLYLDGEPIRTKSAGDLLFEFESAHYPNGTHEIYAVARDNTGISELGGNPSSSIVANETQSVSHFLTFANSLRWTNADHLFDSGVSIIAESDVFPTDYTVFVEDAAGSTVRLFTEQTLDGQIQTYWDGLDGLGNPVPAEQPYTVILALGDLSSPPAALMASSTTSLSKTSGTTVSSQWMLNAHGYQDFIVSKLVETTIAPPPLPPKVVRKDGKLVFEEAKSPRIASEVKSRLVTRIYSLRDFSAAQNSNGTTSLATSLGLEGLESQNANGPGTNNTVLSVYWKERPWPSGEILLARQVLSDAPTLWNTTIAQLLNNIASQVAIADLDIGPNRGVYQNLRYACSAPSDYTQLLDYLTQPSVRNFYYSGHSSGNSIGFSDSVPNHGITVSNLSFTLTNGYSFVPPNKLYFEFHKPFRFVFIDGCESANGKLPEAFGIPIVIKNGYKSRAFMGWTVHARNSLLNTDHRLFTERFWNRWVGDEDYTKRLDTARDQALASVPSINPTELRVFGSPGLTWGD
jgi:hypothetical protein